MLRKKLTKIIKKVVMGVLITATLVGIGTPIFNAFAQSDNRPVVILDAGHGDFDPGCIGADGTTEDSMNYELTVQTKKELESRGIKVIMTRGKDEFKTLGERIRIANSHKESKAYVSIHHNSSNRKAAMGAQVHYDYYNSQGQKIAENMHKSLAEAVQTTDRGAIKSEYYTRHIVQPAVLIETSFISNQSDLDKARNNREDIADAIADSIESFVNGEIK